MLSAWHVIFYTFVSLFFCLSFYPLYADGIRYIAFRKCQSQLDNYLLFSVIAFGMVEMKRVCVHTVFYCQIITFTEAPWYFSFHVIWVTFWIKWSSAFTIFYKAGRVTTDFRVCLSWHVFILKKCLNVKMLGLQVLF